MKLPNETTNVKNQVSWLDIFHKLENFHLIDEYFSDRKYVIQLKIQKPIKIYDEKIKV